MFPLPIKSTLSIKEWWIEKWYVYHFDLLLFLTIVVETAVDSYGLILPSSCFLERKKKKKSIFNTLIYEPLSNYLDHSSLIPPTPLNVLCILDFILLKFSMKAWGILAYAYKSKHGLPFCLVSTNSLWHLKIIYLRRLRIVVVKIFL